MVDLSSLSNLWESSVTTTRLSTGADEAQIVLDYLEADELAAELELIVNAVHSSDGVGFVVRREPDEDGPVIYECDTLAELGAFLAGVSATVGRPTDD